MIADRLLVFAASPGVGAAQTQLTPHLTAAEAAALYEACLRDVIALAARERGRVELWFDGEAAEDRYFSDAFPHVTLRRQRDGHGGTRLADAFARSFDDDAERVIIIGSAVPTIPDGRLTAAFEDLREADAVVGPGLDGGQYLIGLRSVAWPRAAALFRDPVWNTRTVLDATLARAAQTALELRLLPGWYAIDRVEDIERARLDALPQSHLAEWLRAHGEGG